MEVQNYDKITDKLLPCPFCGGTPVWYRKGNDYTKSQTIIVKCPKCRIERNDAILNNHGHTIEWLEEVAIKNWNQRAFIAGAQWQKKQTENDNEKLSKAVRLGDAMYYAAQMISTDASHLRKAIDDWWNFKNVELNNKE